MKNHHRKENLKLENQCFYCANDIEYGKAYHVTFISDQNEHEKPLCDVCYSEWLEGIKE